MVFFALKNTALLFVKFEFENSEAFLNKKSDGATKPI